MTLEVMGYHVKFARFVLFPVSEEAKTWFPFFFVQCIINQSLDSVFVISQNNQSLQYVSNITAMLCNGYHILHNMAFAPVFAVVFLLLYLLLIRCNDIWPFYPNWHNYLIANLRATKRRGYRQQICIFFSTLAALVLTLKLRCR